MRSLLAILMFVSTSTWAEVVEIKVPTAEDGDVLAKFDKGTRKPIGASDDRVEVTGVRLAVFTGQSLEWTWTYSVRFKVEVGPVRIRIEDESQRANLLEVESTQPALKDLMWSGEAPRKPFTKSVFDQMQGNGTWFYMRKFTIEFADGTKTVLHQPVMYTQADRVNVLQTIMKAAH